LSASEIGDGFATMLIDGIGQQPVTVGKSGNKGAAGRATRQPNAEGAGTKGAGTKGAGTKGAGTKRADTGKSTAAGSKTAATTLIPGAVPRKPRT